jgi:hypothetical protein
MFQSCELVVLSGMLGATSAPSRRENVTTSENEVDNIAEPLAIEITEIPNALGKKRVESRKDSMMGFGPSLGPLEIARSYSTTCPATGNRLPLAISAGVLSKSHISNPSIHGVPGGPDRLQRSRAAATTRGLYD